jgi:hypothetical protein
VGIKAGREMTVRGMYSSRPRDFRKLKRRKEKGEEI